MWLLLVFMAVPLIEIALFIRLGGAIGLWPTLLVVVLTAIAGTWLVRRQGAQALSRLRGSLDELRDPIEPLAHGAMILIAGVLLLTPGFFTDTIGFLLLFPPFRAAACRHLAARIQGQGLAAGSRQSPQESGAGAADVIEGEYREVPPEKRPDQGDSGRTGH